MSASSPPAAPPRASKLSMLSTGSSASSPPLLSWLRKSIFGSSSNSLLASSSSSSPTAAAATAAFRRHKEEEEEEATRKATAAAAAKEQEEEEEEGHSASECPICTTVSKRKLSYALPCQHRACDRCWASWAKQYRETQRNLQQHKKQTQEAMHCLLCNQPVTAVRHVKTIKKQSVAAVGDEDEENDDASHVLRLADDQFEDTLRIVLGVKNDLEDVRDKLAGTENHLGFLHETAQLGELDQDALVSIVQVELVVIKEQLRSLIQLAGNPIPALPPSLAKLNQHMERVLARLPELMTGSRTEGEEEESDVERFAGMLATGTTNSTSRNGTTLKSQWDAVFTLLAGLLDASVVSVISFMVPSEADSVLKLMDQIKAKLSLHLPAITASGAEFEALAQRFIHRVHDEKVL